ncbi:MAG TPA: arginine--tRNA ligase [Solirubrobacteraceae bacterium]|nr:arginine--tRNA ligase [Solirubrobacteraceae bacterium]
MSTVTTDPVSDLHAALERAVASVRGAHAPGAAPSLERPKRVGQGDYATNAAMLLAPALGEAPRAIAERVSAALAAELGDALDRVEIAGPGFVNLVLADGWFRRAVGVVLGAGERYGAGGTPAPERVLVEFVSANPTGPVVAASGRHAAFGDSLARILAHHGHHVGREYYVNDYGSQVLRLGESVRARALGEPVPEDGYQGDYIATMAEAVPGAADPAVSVAELSQRSVVYLLEQIRTTLSRYGVDFDRFFSERSLHEGAPAAVGAVITRLREAGHVYEHDGAVWLRTTTFGDDKDRVLFRTGGDHTYFASDIAYMESKRQRDWERQIIVLGADHHGYVGRLKAAFQTLGGEPDLLEPIIMQLVHLVEGGEKAKMSKRRGEFVTLDELLDEIGVDATRYFMLQSSHDRSLDLNLDLARSQSSENPVYYIQYAHARIHSILEKVGAERVAGILAAGGAEPGAETPLHPSERELVLKLLALPGDIAEAAERRAPHRMAGYALELAQQFTAFYRDCKVAGAEPADAEAFRVRLCVATRGVLALVLGLLGVSAPTTM